MIELGKIQKLQVIREVTFGVYLGEAEGDNEEVVLLPIKQVPKDTLIGDEIEVFVYRDSEDRMIATTREPKLTIGTVASLKVVDTTPIGAFLDWGLEKDLFLPFKQQLLRVEKGRQYVVGLYTDKANRLCATMKVYNMLSCESSYKEGDMVEGIVYKVNPELGAFVAVEGRYNGLVLNKELYGEYKVGDTVTVRIKRIREDGKLELSLRQTVSKQMEVDAKKIMDTLDRMGGELPLNDKSEPERIKDMLGMSKGSFKRSVGRLLKEGAIEITEWGIKRRW